MNAQQPQNGFTLLEVMLVIALMAVISAAAVVNIRAPGPEQTLQTESRRFAALLEWAVEQAVFSSQQLGVILDSDGYRFLRLEEDNWVEIQDDPVLKPRQLPELIATRLELEGLPWLQADRLTSAGDSLFEELFEEDEQRLLPQIYIYSYGEFSPFSLYFRVDSAYDQVATRYVVNGVYDEVQLTQVEHD